jgi:hypothetical protein
MVLVDSDMRTTDPSGLSPHTRRCSHVYTDFIIALFCRVDAKMTDLPKHSQAKLYPSEVVTLALIFALKGVGPRAFYRWLSRDYRSLLPQLPERTRLFRLFAAHRHWADYFLAQPTVLGVADGCVSIQATRLRASGTSGILAPDHQPERGVPDALSPLSVYGDRPTIQEDSTRLPHVLLPLNRAPKIGQ